MCSSDLLGGWYIARQHAAPIPELAALPHAVAIASIADLANDTAPLPVIGTVMSQNEADIRSEAGGGITKLNHSLGDYVTAGEIIAQIENSSERAAALQAQGALEAAQASAAKSSVNLGQSKTSIVDTIRGIYATNDDLIRAKLDVVFSNADSPSPVFNFTVPDNNLVNKTIQERMQVGTILHSENARAQGLTERDRKSVV